MNILYHCQCILFTFLFLSAIHIPSYATHNRAGEITIKQVGDCESSLTIEATVTVYAKTSSPIDRDSLIVFWGDGSWDKIARSNGNGEFLENDTQKNIYKGEHRYNSRGTYIISMTDQNRNADIVNLNNPFSDQIPFHIQTIYTFTNPAFQGCNDTPIMHQPPTDLACVGEVFTHNPNAADPNGDSLSFHFAVPLRGIDYDTDPPTYLEVMEYNFPNEINPNADNNLSLNTETGEIVWDAPQSPGEYNLTMIIVEYREGTPLDTIWRDMQILVLECDNTPPEVEVEEEICIVAGELLELDVVATAPLSDEDQKVRLTALGGPFDLEISPATFIPNDNEFQEDPLTKKFIWQTTCEHISDQFYTVVFKAVDNALGDTTGLASLKTVRIKVVGPPPQNLSAAAGTNQIILTWDKPYVCDEVDDEYFRGFSIWRRLNSNLFDELCNPGLEGKGYQRITPFPIQEMEDGQYRFVDTAVESGQTYCYRVLAEFAQSTPTSGLTYNRVESITSNEACVQSNRSIPLMTKVNVLETSEDQGKMEVCWSKPRIEDLDTSIYLGPYIYEIWRSEVIPIDEEAFSPLGLSFSSPFFGTANDTCFVDSDLNTKNQPFIYRVHFYASMENGESFLIGKTSTASSVFLNIAPTNNQNDLSWEVFVPWENTLFEVYRRNELGELSLLATVDEPRYMDTELVNGQEYCYLVKSIGTYNLDGLPDPILNWSQEVCSVPVDNIPPCAPTLEVSNICNNVGDCPGAESPANTLYWDLCFESMDVARLEVFYKRNNNTEEAELIGSLNDRMIKTFEHNPAAGVAGCYYVVAIDSVGNRSEKSNIVCLDNCPTYVLPNTFTPNGDGQNDLFKPYPYCFVESVDFKVFNRWGQMVFETNDPNINWNGQNLKGQLVSNGVYFYVCRVFEERSIGVIQAPSILKGYIEVFGSINP